ncbi:MAG: ABC transporter permease [Chloroflexi bacterium]|nr:ABC transporter permease [Chloroflexota bacterium]
MVEPRGTRIALRVVTVLVLCFIYLPLIVIGIYAFNDTTNQAWPLQGFSLRWFERAFEQSGVRDALWGSIRAGLGATAIALVLGSLAAFAVHRFRFFGRDSISLLLILPIALPGIVTGMALNAAFRTVGFDFGMVTIIIGHATFCVVLVYNNVLARARRISGSLEEASMDLGADQLQTFRYVTFPAIRTALLAGGLLAFALSFDEVIVTTFTTGGGERTIPIWILQNYTRTSGLPIVNAVALILILLSVVPVYFAQRLAGAEATGPR